MSHVQFLSDEVGSLFDSVRIQLGDDEIRIAESWDVAESVLSQPATWSVRVGNGDVAADLLKRYPPRTPFKLFVGDALQHSGRLDSRGASNQSGATQITFRGRDGLAALHDSHVRAQESFRATSYADLVRRALKLAGLDPSKLVGSNDANRSLKAGIPVTAGGVLSHRTVDEIIAGKDDKLKIGGIVEHELQAKLNETWHQFVRRHIDKAGLFLWATADEEFVLTQPNADQPPTYRLIRLTGQPEQGANVVGMEFEDDATHRHSEAVIYGRTGGKKHGRAKSKGGVTDDEMLDYGYDQAIVFRDVNVQTPAEAEFFALRKLAEERREGYHLEYTVPGHTLPSAQQPGQRAVLVPDTTVEVDDQELGIQGVFYIESVRKQRAGKTTSTIRLMRLDDLIFGGADE